MAWLGAAESDEVPGPTSQLYFETLRKGLLLNRIDHLQRRPQRFHEVSRGDALVVEGANPSWHDQCPRFFPMPFGEKDTFRSQDQIHFAPCREIGRASCRESWTCWVVGVTLEKTGYT